MEMQVDSRRIRSERERRAWSQEHLAGVAGLGLRTIQRIESTGAASYDSVRALAVALDVPVAELRVEQSPAVARPAFRLRRLAVGAAAAALAGIGLVLLRPALADEVTLDVGVAINDEDQGLKRLSTEAGTGAELEIGGVLRLVIVPTIRDDGLVLLSTSIYELADGGQRLLSQPQLATGDATVAEIRLGADSGNVYRFLITPRRS